MKKSLVITALLSAFVTLPAFADGRMPPSPQVLLTGTDGSEFACMGGAAAVTSACSQLPTGLSAVAQVLMGNGLPGIGQHVDPSQQIITVATPSGNETCPVSAFSMSSEGKNKLLDATKCTASTSTATPRVVCTNDAAVSTTLLTCAAPTAVVVTNPFQQISGSCPGGGSRTVTGGYDTKTGVLDTTITLTACKDWGGVTHDGTVVLQGNDVLGTGTSYTINDTKTISAKLTFPSGNAATRQCTIARAGTFDSSKGAFNGTITRSNCSLAGSLRMGGLLDFLVDDGIGSEEHEGASGSSGL